MSKKTIKIAVHAGHAVKGARGASALMDEVVVNRKLKKYVIKYLKKMGATVIDCSIHEGSAWDVLAGIHHKFKRKSKGTYGWHNISIHLNAGGGNGVEVWTRAGITSHLDAMLKGFCGTTGFKNRGVRRSSSLYVLNNLPNCQLWEVGFVDSKKDKAVYDRLGVKKIAKSMAESIMLYAK